MNVLIVNKFLMGDANAVGATMQSNLYGMMDGDEPVNFLQYCIDDRPNAHAKMVESIFMDSKDSVDGYLKSLKRKLTGRKENETNLNASEVKTDNKPATKSAIPSTQVSKKGELMRGVYYSLPTKVSKANMARIKEFNPDLIYTQGESIRVLNQTIKLAKKLKVPVVFHCMDDFKSTLYTGSSLAKIFNKKLNAKIRKVNKLSVENLGICEKMAKHYSETYNKPYSYASNCVTNFGSNNYQKDLNKNMTVLFSGAMHFHRGDTLLLASAAIEQLNAEGKNIDLKIYGPKTQIEAYGKDFAKYPHTTLLPYVPQSEVVKNLETADVLIHVEPFEKGDIRFVKYSFSTKLAEYLASGRCVIGLGPKDVAGIEYIKDNECGLVAGSQDEVKDALLYLYNNPEERVRYAKKAYDVAENYHTHQKVQDRILKVFKHSLGEE